MDSKGFSYVEILAAVILMAVALVPILSALSNPKRSSIQETYLFLNAARDKMEEVLAMNFSAIPIGTSLSDTVSIGGKVIQRNVNVQLHDLNGDLTPEADAKNIAVTVEQNQLSALKVGP